MARQSSERQRFEILLEQVQSELHTVAEGHGALDQRLQKVEQRIERLDQKVERLDQKVDHGFATLGQRIGFVEAAVLDVRKDLKGLDQRLDAHLAAHTT